MDREELPRPPVWLHASDKVKLEEGANALAVAAKAVNRAATFMLKIMNWSQEEDL